jgi:hypothetical protein
MESVNLIEAVVIGVGVFIVGQYFLDFVLKPIQTLRDEISKTGFLLKFYANRIFERNEETEVIRKEFRGNAFNLQRLVVLPHGYYLFRFLFNLPKVKDVFDASQTMVGLSNTVGERTSEDPKHEREAEIRTKLRLPQ